MAMEESRVGEEVFERLKGGDEVMKIMRLSCM